MKKQILAGLTTASLLLTVGEVSHALTINGGSIDIGNVDTLIASSAQINNPTNELDFAKTILGSSTTSAGTIDSFNWQQVDGSTTIFAQSLKNNPGNFLVKTGNLLGTNDFRDFLFTNVSNTGYAVIDLSVLSNAVGGGKNGGTGELSHMQIFNGTNPAPANPVPEPATMLLFGTGIAGLAAVCRQKKN